MRDSLKRICDEYIKNYEAVRKEVKHEAISYVYPLGAYIFTANGKTADPEVIKKCKQIVKENAGTLSAFRGNAHAPTVCMLAVSSDPESEMKSALEYNKMLSAAFGSSDHFAGLSLMMKRLEASCKAEDLITRSKEIFDAVKKKHRFVTGAEDAVMSVLLALKNRTPEQVVEETEKIMAELKPYGDTNAVQTAAQVLAVSDMPTEEKCSRFKALFDGLRERGRKYSKNLSIAMLAGAAVLDADVNTLLDDICAVDDELAQQTPYKGTFTGFNKSERLMHSAMLLSLDYCSEGSDYMTAISNITTMFVTNEIVTLSILMADSALVATILSVT
ncbi:Protein of unknown function [Ruminococcaceae bacterium FB2012]|nr:Protein of unknown function [Ruminococcaceae bacterium FB2012]